MTETTTTPDRTALAGKILSQAAFTATIDAPIGKIDIAGWLRTLSVEDSHVPYLRGATGRGIW